jgi:two-component system response regulator QseB
MRVLVVEDNVRMAELLAEGLGRRGFTCDIGHDLAEASDFVTATTYDVLLLDLGLPDGDGVDWMRRLPRERSPVLVLTARDTLADRVAGLDSGADDYLVKPADIEEIAARLRALLRRPGLRVPAILRVGPLTFDPASREAKVEDQPLKLARREADLLEHLMRCAGAVTPRESIEASLYAWDDAVTPNAIEAVASRLRRRLAEAGAGGMLHAVRGVGYYLGAPRP